MRIRYTAPFLLVALLAGCGGGSPVSVQSSGAVPPTASSETSADASASSSDGADPASSTSASDDASPGTGDPSSASPAPTGTLDAAELATRVQAAAAAMKTARVAMTGGGTGAFTGSVRFGEDDVAMSLTMSSAGQKVKALLVDDAFYLNLGQKVKGKTWLKIDENSKDEMGAVMGPMLSTIKQQSRPGEGLAGLAGVTAKAGRGPVIDSVPTVAYVLRLNSQQIIAGLPEANREALAPSLAGATSVATYYVGRDWLLRKVATVTTVQGKRTTVAITYTKWGSPVTIAAPPASDVATSIA